MQMPTVHVCIVGEGSGGTAGAHTLTFETRYSLLQVTSSAPAALTHSTYLSIAQVLQC